LLGKFSIAVKTFGVCDFSRLAVTDWRLRRWRLWFLALMTATQNLPYVTDSLSNFFIYNLVIKRKRRILSLSETPTPIVKDMLRSHCFSCEKKFFSHVPNFIKFLKCEGGRTWSSG